MSATNRSFPKSMRLQRPAQFAAVFKQGRRARTRYFTVISLDNNLSHPRLGLAVSKKNTPRAVDRNRLKRIIRESFRQHASFMLPADIVVQTTRSATQRSPQSLWADLASLWPSVG